MKPELVKIKLLNAGEYYGIKNIKFPVEVFASIHGKMWAVSKGELFRVGCANKWFEGDYDSYLFFLPRGVIVNKNKTPAPRFRKQRIAPPVRVKSDVRITYNGGVGYTITNVKQIIISKDSDAAFITSIVKGIKTQVELPLSEINSIKLKTPSSTYDFHVEGAYPDVLIVNPKLGMTASAKYFSLNLED